MIKITQKDLKASDLLIPGWYILDVKGVELKPAKSDQSTNYNFKLEPVANEKGDTSCVGVKVKDFLINEKGLFSTGIAFLGSCGVPQATLDAVKAGKAPDVEVNEQSCVGKRIKGFIKNTTYEGRVSNECSDFMPLEKK